MNVVVGVHCDLLRLLPGDEGSEEAGEVFLSAIVRLEDMWPSDTLDAVQDLIDGYEPDAPDLQLSSWHSDVPAWVVAAQIGATVTDDWTLFGPSLSWSIAMDAPELEPQCDREGRYLVPGSSRWKDEKDEVTA